MRGSWIFIPVTLKRMGKGFHEKAVIPFLSGGLGYAICALATPFMGVALEFPRVCFVKINSRNTCVDSVYHGFQFYKSKEALIVFPTQAGKNAIIANDSVGARVPAENFYFL